MTLPATRRQQVAICAGVCLALFLLAHLLGRPESVDYHTVKTADGATLFYEVGIPGWAPVRPGQYFHHAMVVGVSEGQSAPKQGLATRSPSISAPHARALLRVLVLTYNRKDSLLRCLESLNKAEYDGLPVAVDIHIDISKSGKVHNDTVAAARAWVFKHGQSRVLVKAKHSGVRGQWLHSWDTPEDPSSEIGVFVEDDIVLSPYFARYLRRAHAKYDVYQGINAFALQAISCMHQNGWPDLGLKGPPGKTFFLYPILGSWGFSPNTAWWKHFIKWYDEFGYKESFVPKIKGLKPTDWYRIFHKTGRAETMWEMHHIWHSYEHRLLTLYVVPPDGLGLAFNFQEAGEHYNGDTRAKKAKLVEKWSEERFALPDTLPVVDARGVDTGHSIGRDVYYIKYKKHA